MLKNMIGVEAEFFMVNKKGEAIVPPSYFDRDDFPLLGEIRGAPGKTTAETYANFIKQEMIISSRVVKDAAMIMDNIMRIKLATYRKAMKTARDSKQDKPATLDAVKNIYGTNINDFSDQIIGENKKIQGINASCGLHIHFSSEMTVEKKITKNEYEMFSIPLTHKQDGESGGVKTYIDLYRYKGYTTDKTITARASQLNQPTIEWIVKQMDDEFFERFAPTEAERTKYRQPGYYETKPYGFEYRSLPANKDSIANLPMIIEFAFDLLKKLTVK